MSGPSGRDAMTSKERWPAATVLRQKLPPTAGRPNPFAGVAASPLSPRQPRAMIPLALVLILPAHVLRDWRNKRLKTVHVGLPTVLPVKTTGSDHLRRCT